MTKNNVNHTHISIGDELSDELQSVFGIETKNGKPITPNGDLPEFAKKRCDWARKYADTGLNFFDQLTIVLAFDEDLAKKKFKRGALPENWMPVTEEFRNWVQSTWSNLRQKRVALYLIYANASVSCKEAE